KIGIHCFESRPAASWVSVMISVLPRFFFQAEDGIRALIVTGVQTCALPISVRGLSVAEDKDWAKVHVSITALIKDAQGQVVDKRSEERRVGKEGGALW